MPPVSSYRSTPRTATILVLSIAALLGVFGTASVPPVRADERPEQTAIISVDPWIEAAPHVLVLRIAPGVSIGANAAVAGTSDGTYNLADTLRQAGVTGVRPLLPAGSSVAVAGGEISRLARSYRLQLNPAASLQQAKQTLAANPGVEYVEYDYIARGVLVPNDPEYPNQWAAPRIGLPAAWDAGTGSADVVIALVDSGIDPTHPDLAGRLWVNAGEVPGNGVDDDANGYIDDVNGWNFVANSSNLVDPYGHGTQVAGVMAAVGNNGKGIAGVCWQCKIMVVTAMQNGGAANYSDIAAAVAYASSNGADIINLSLGGYADSSMLADAVTEAAVTAVLVGGAGNDDGTAPFYPAAYPEVVGVAATNSTDAKAVFSNYGAWVDVAAPGDAIRTTALGGGYGTDSGTSLATAYASGVAGLIASKHPDWSPDLVAWQLLNTAASIDGQNAAYVGQLGHGRLAANQAVAVNPQPAGEVAGTTVDGQTGGQPAPGATFNLVVNVRNLWLPGRGLSGALSTTSNRATITSATGSFGDIEAGHIGSNAATPFTVRLAANTPYAAAIPFTLNLTGSSGYALTLSFTVRVRSAVETLGNTNYAVNTTWTSDKTYVLNGAVIVAAGATLTIQPGTVVKVAAEKFIRVDGTLIAKGTADQPIVFTANTTDARWAGLRFTASAVDAAFNPDGSYQSGSIVQYVDLSDADVGVTLNGRAPYIADSHFRGAPSAVDTGGNQTIRIERNTVEGGALNVGGAATVLQNTLTGAGEACGINLTGGSPLLMQNTLDGCTIGGQGQFPVVISNTVRGGAVNLNLSSANGSGKARLPSFLSGPRMSAIAAGENHTCALTTAGGVLCWGQNGFGQLGNGTTTGRSTPMAVTELSSGVVAIAAGHGHTCALTTAGGVLCWGYNNAGQLGHGTNVDSSTPVAVTGLSSGVAAIAAGTFHTCALTTARGVKCWGGNGVGELGDGTSTSSTTPVAVMDLSSGVAAITAGNQHTCALTNAGGVLCWGGNWYGELGDGTTTSSSTPVAVTGLGSGVAAVTASAGWGNSCALTIAGGVLCWGANGSGELGDGTTTPRTTPVAVTGLSSGIIAIAAGSDYTCALTNSGSVLCWGYNGEGQLGDGTTTNRSTPVAVTGLNSIVTTVAVGGSHTCALTPSGDALCWGGNGIGQLGDGTYGSSTTPVDVADGNIRIQGNSIHGGSGMSVSLEDIAGEVYITHNTIGQNTGTGLALSGLTRGDNLTIRNNNLFSNGVHDLQLEPGAPGTQNFTVDTSGNYWGVASGQIANRIGDCTFDANGCDSANSTIGKVRYDPPLSAPDQVAPAFVTSIKMTPDPVGLQQGKLVVNFSRPMKTDSVPSAIFHDSRRGTPEHISIYLGGSMPHTPYTVLDILGRVWVTVGVDSNKAVGESPIVMYDGNTWHDLTPTDVPIGFFGARPAASLNGDMWFAIKGNLLKYAGGSWTVFPNAELSQYPWVLSVEPNGTVWASAEDRTLLKFTNLEWQPVPLSHDGREMHIYYSYNKTSCVDKLGRVWFLLEGTLSSDDPIPYVGVVANGIWAFYAKTKGLTGDPRQSILCDQAGRVWVGIENSTDGSNVAMFDGAGWTGISWPGDTMFDTNWDFVVDADGVIWRGTSDTNVAVGYRDGDWVPRDFDISDSPGIDSLPFIIDRHKRVYRVRGWDIQVVHGRLEYPFTNGRWVSPTRFEATYDFTAAVPRATYNVAIGDAFGADGLPAVPPRDGISFTVAYAGAVSTLPPYPPQVTASGRETLPTFTASWQSASEGVAGYRYAIGTVPGGRDVIGWTYTGATGFSRNDLKLAHGRTYYVTVQARGANGLWSGDGVGQAATVTFPPSAFDHRLFITNIAR